MRLAPARKRRASADAIGSFAASPLAAAQRYKVRALPTLGYVARLAALDRLDARVATRVLGLPPQSVARSDHFALEVAGGPRVLSAVALVAAARTRSARITLTTWPTIRDLISTVNADSANIAALADGIWWPSFWDAPPCFDAK